MVDLNGDHFILPAKDTALAEAVIAKGSWYYLGEDAESGGAAFFFEEEE